MLLNHRLGIQVEVELRRLAQGATDPWPCRLLSQVLLVRRVWRVLVVSFLVDGDAILLIVLIKLSPRPYRICRFLIRSIALVLFMLLEVCVQSISFTIRKELFGFELQTITELRNDAFLVAFSRC